MSKFYDLTVEQVRQETADACSFTFNVPEELREIFAYQSGQFLTFEVPYGDENLLRCYSMSSSSIVDSKLQVCVKRVDNGRASNWFCDNLQPGKNIKVKPPAGIFTVKHNQDDLLLFAGGSGITPVYSILKSALYSSDNTVRLIYANRDVDSIIFRHEIRRLQQRFPERFEVFHLLDDLQSYPKSRMLSALTYNMTHAQVYICGPSPFMNAVEKALSKVCVNPQQIHIEKFISLESPTEHLIKESEIIPELNSGANINVSIYGDNHTFPCSPTETILQAASNAGIELPFSCEVGMCASCMCEITEGDVELLTNEVLSENDLNNQIILTCQAIPKAKNIKLKFT